MPLKLLGPGKLRFPRRSRTARVLAALAACAFIAAAYAWIYTRVATRPIHFPFAPGVALSIAKDVMQIRSVVRWNSTDETALGYTVIHTHAPPPVGIEWWNTFVPPAPPLLYDRTFRNTVRLYTTRADGTSLSADWIESSVIILPMRNVLIALLLIALALIGIPRRYARVGHCMHCDYNLTGNESGRCPECGASTAAKARVD
ncbi:MAG: hypothetical protein ACKVS9_09965 [Phycisphaerae bacterium]